MTTTVSRRASELGQLCGYYHFQWQDLFDPAAPGSELYLVLPPNRSDETLSSILEEALSLSTISFLFVASDWARPPKDFCCELERG
ncbi:MAG: hypothetical protein OXK78_13485 [Caldilineaceae bacterium]|nr:hypothetical protein [Caldilineaceae bacterium]